MNLVRNSIGLGSSQIHRSPSQFEGLPTQVRQGEKKLSQVAQRLGVSEEALLRANPQILGSKNLKVGQEIQLPTRAASYLKEMASSQTGTQSGAWGQPRALQANQKNLGRFRELSQIAPPSLGPNQAAASQIQKTFQAQFSTIASDKTQFHSLMKEVYGQSYDVAAAESFRKKALAGDFSWLPKIEFKGDRTLQGGNGAFDASRNVVYINERFLNDPSRAAKVYTEEVGHFLDSKLNKADSAGDEGEMFRHLLSGEKLTAGQKAAIRSDNDQGVIMVNGKATRVEFSFWDDAWDGAKKVGGATVNGAKKVGEAIVDGAKAVGGAAADGAKAVGGAFWKGVKAVGNFVVDGAKKVGSAIWDGIKTVGGAVWKGVKWVGGAIADAAKWVGPRLGDGVKSLVGGAWNTVTGAVRNVAEGIGTFFGGLGKIFTGDFKGGFADLGLGLLKVFVQTPVDAVLLMGGRAISAIQTLVGLEPVGRKLTSDEIAELRKVYGDSIDYSKVQIKEGNAGLFSTTGRAFTHGNTIYIPAKDLPLSKELLVHEMGHVWQNQNGGTDYMSEALWGQNFGDGYDFAKGIDEGKSWSELNPEQQAELLEKAYESGFFDSPGARFTYNSKDYTDFLNAALRQVRSGNGAT